MLLFPAFLSTTCPERSEITFIIRQSATFADFHIFPLLLLAREDFIRHSEINIQPLVPLFPSFPSTTCPCFSSANRDGLWLRFYVDRLEIVVPGASGEAVLSGVHSKKWILGIRMDKMRANGGPCALKRSVFCPDNRVNFISLKV